MVFVMVYHLHTPLTIPMPSSQMKQHHKILKSLLNTLMHNLKTNFKQNFDISVNIADFVGLRLFVCGGAVGKKDAEPDAFSLLIKQDSTINDRL
jgi:hypothetical protein